MKKRQIQSVIKFLSDNFLKIFETLSALGDCKATLIEGVVYTKAMIFEVFREYLSDFLIFLHEISCDSKILLSNCDEHQMFDYGIIF